jgi:hypothetical protein
VKAIDTRGTTREWASMNCCNTAECHAVLRPGSGFIPCIIDAFMLRHLSCSCSRRSPLSRNQKAVCGVADAGCSRHLVQYIPVPWCLEAQQNHAVHAWSLDRILTPSAVHSLHCGKTWPVALTVVTCSCDHCLVTVMKTCDIG